MRKGAFWHVRPSKTQISLRVRSVWLESSLSAWRTIAPLAVQNAPSEGSDQTAQMRRLIWIFAERTYSKVRIFAGHIYSKVRFLTLRLISISVSENIVCAFQSVKPCRTQYMHWIWIIKVLYENGTKLFKYVLVFEQQHATLKVDTGATFALAKWQKLYSKLFSLAVFIKIFSISVKFIGKVIWCSK